MHDIAVQCAGVYCVIMHGMDMPGGKKPICNANLRKKSQFFPIICPWIIFADLKKKPDWKYKKHPADTSLKEDLSIDIAFDPTWFSLDTPFKLMQLPFLIFENLSSLFNTPLCWRSLTCE
jgi:hypothetical protein